MANNNEGGLRGYINRLTNEYVIVHERNRGSLSDQLAHQAEDRFNQRYVPDTWDSRGMMRMMADEKRRTGIDLGGGVEHQQAPPYRGQWETLQEQAAKQVRMPFARSLVDMTPEEKGKDYYENHPQERINLLRQRGGRQLLKKWGLL